MADKLHTIQLKHRLEFANKIMPERQLLKLQKDHAKNMDKQFQVKVEFISGVFDDEYKVTGYDAELRKMLRDHFNMNNDRIAQKYPEIC